MLCRKVDFFPWLKVVTLFCFTWFTLWLDFLVSCFRYDLFWLWVDNTNPLSLCNFRKITIELILTACQSIEIVLKLRAFSKLPVQTCHLLLLKLNQIRLLLINNLLDVLVCLLRIAVNLLVADDTTGKVAFTHFEVGTTGRA